MQVSKTLETKLSDMAQHDADYLQSLEVGAGHRSKLVTPDNTDSMRVLNALRAAKESDTLGGAVMIRVFDPEKDIPTGTPRGPKVTILIRAASDRLVAQLQELGIPNDFDTSEAAMTMFKAAKDEKKPRANIMEYLGRATLWDCPASLLMQVLETVDLKGILPDADRVSLRSAK